MEQNKATTKLSPGKPGELHPSGRGPGNSSVLTPRKDSGSCLPADSAGNWLTGLEENESSNKSNCRSSTTRFREMWSSLPPRPAAHGRCDQREGAVALDLGWLWKGSAALCAAQVAAAAGSQGLWLPAHSGPSAATPQAPEQQAEHPLGP